MDLSAKCFQSLQFMLYQPSIPLVFMRRKVFIVMVLFMLSPFLVFSQPQKLEKLLLQWKKISIVAQQKPDTSAIILLNSIVNEYVQTASDSAFIYSEKALALSKILHYTKGSAITYINIGRMHYMKCNYDQSLNNALIGLKLSTQLRDNAGIAAASNVIGLIYLSQKKPSLALREFIKASKINIVLNNQTRLSSNYLNIGLTYLMAKSDSAVYYFSLSKSVSKSIDDRHLIAMANNRLGDYYLQKGQAKKAIFYYYSVLRNKKYQNEWENSFAYTGLAKCYFKLHRYKEATVNGEKGLLLAKKNNTKWDVEQALRTLHESFNALGDSKNAYKYLLMDKIYSDSLFDASKEREINALNLRQKQAENEVLIKKNQIAEEKEATHQLVILVIVLIAIFLMIITLITFRNASKNKKLYQALQKKSDFIATQNELIEQKNEELNHSNQTKDRLFSIIGHDLRGPFATVLNALELFKSEDLEEEEKVLMLDRILEQMYVTSAMLENLLAWANSQREGLKTQSISLSLTGIINEILSVFVMVAGEKNIQLIHLFEEPLSIKGDPDQIRILFQNLVANAIKFTKPKGNIVISYAVSDTAIKVSIKDDGVGMSEEKLKLIFQESGKSISTYGTKKEKGIGIGLMLVKKFVELNNATISVTSKEQQGTEFVVEFTRI